MDLFLDPEAGKPLTAQLYEQLRRAITGGRLLPDVAEPEQARLVLFWLAR